MQPTLTIVRPGPYRKLFGPVELAGDCLDFVAPHASVWFDLKQECRSGDVCLVRDNRNSGALMKQIEQRADGRWLLKTSFSILPMEDRYVPLAPVVAIAEHIGPAKIEGAALHEPHRRKFAEFLDEMERRYPKQVSRSGGLITSIVGNGPVWQGT